jgi:hypothetical protein
MTEAQMGRWYMVNRDGMATLCADREDAEKEAADAQSVWPHMGPHRAVRLVEASFEAADMATAAAQGFRDGAASIAANAGEPVAHLWQHCETGRTRIVMPDMIVDADASWQVVGPLYLGAAPPTAQAEGWTKLPGTLPKPGTPVLLDIGKEFPIRAMWAAKFTLPVSLEDYSGFGEHDERTDEWYCPEGWYEWNEHEEIHWRVTETPRAWAPLPPTTSAGSGNGE